MTNRPFFILLDSLFATWSFISRIKNYTSFFSSFKVIITDQQMIISYFKSLIIKNKAFILEEVLAVKGLMQLLMKERNTNQKWTREEKREIKIHLKNISKLVPALIIFLLPGGSLLLPFLAEVLDRRKSRRPPVQKERTNGDLL
jgi:hypothetical protein